MPGHGHGVERDHPDAVDGERVVAGGPVRRQALRGVDEPEAVVVGLGAGVVQRLVLALVDELAIGIGRDRGGGRRSQDARRGELVERQAPEDLRTAGGDILEGPVGRRVALDEAVVIAERDVAGHA